MINAFRSLGRHAGLALLTTSVLSVPATQSHAEVDCEIPVDEAVEAATANGFVFEAEPVDASNGSCLKRFPVVVVSAADDQPSTCTIVWFGGRKLAPEWKFNEMGFFGSVFSYEVEPAAGEQSLSTKLLVTVEAGQTTVFKLKRLELSGPACSDWPDAFASSTTLEDD